MGQPLPDFLVNAPKLQLGLQVFLQAFFDLDSERSNGMGVTMIPWSSIKNYAQAYDFDTELTEDLIYLVRQMDIAHTKRMEEKSKVNDGANSRRIGG